MGPLPASFCTGRNKFRVAKNSVLLNHPHSQFPVLTSSPSQSDKKTIRINAVIMFIQKGMIYPGLSAIGRSIQDPVWMVICTVTSFIPAYIKHDTNLDSQATASPMDSYPHISLYLIPFPIISNIQNLSFVLSEAHNLPYIPTPLPPTTCFLQPPLLTEIWHSSEHSASHLGLEVVVVGPPCSMVLPPDHCPSLRPRSTQIWPTHVITLCHLFPAPTAVINRLPERSHLFLKDFNSLLFILFNTPLTEFLEISIFT